MAWHGRLAPADLPAPALVAASDQAARPGYASFHASEYRDSPEVLRAKVQLLVGLWKASRATVVYTGAGISTAAGIGDYASRANAGSVAPHKAAGGAGRGSRLDLQPTLAHHCLASLGLRGKVGNWVQQNHDRLSQKAGFPQEKLNEIHGAWGDNKNCVKMMDDNLRRDLIDWLGEWAERADFCVALGTSMCGMNADQVPTNCALRCNPEAGQFGLAIIGLQKTGLDEVASLRIWGLCDEVMALVCKEFGCPAKDPRCVQRGAQWDKQHPRLTYNTPVHRPGSDLQEPAAKTQRREASRPRKSSSRGRSAPARQRTATGT